MKALVLEEYNKLVYKDVVKPVANGDEGLVEIKAVGICGSDVHGMDGSTGRRIPPTGVKMQEPVLSLTPRQTMFLVKKTNSKTG